MKVTYEIENGKKIKVKTYANGTVKKYDEKGNMIYFNAYSIGLHEGWYEYDSKGHCIHHNSTSGLEQWHEYDSNGNEIHFKSNRGIEWWCEYDADGKLIYNKNSKGYEWFAKDYEKRRVC